MGVFHHVLIKYGYENAEMQKRKFDDVTLQYSVDLCFNIMYNSSYEKVSGVTDRWVGGTVPPQRLSTKQGKEKQVLKMENVGENEEILKKQGGTEKVTGKK